MIKKTLSVLVCGTLFAGAMLGLAGCGGSDAIELTVWGSAAQQETLAQMAEEFKKANPENEYKITIGIGEEDMAFSNVGKDPSAAADVYCYSNDQLIPLLRVGALARIGGANLESVKELNTADSVASGSLDYGTENEKVYGYPYASDNGYFMFYDKSVVSEEDTATLENIIESCKKNGKKIGWALDVPWYTAGWFFTFGGEYSVEYDYSANYAERNVDVNFNSEDVGIKASKAMAKLASSGVFAGQGTDNEKITTGFTTGKMAVAVSGTWIAKRVQAALGENYGVCKLPTVEVDGESKQLYSFKGYKLWGVNPHCSPSAVSHAHKLAAFLSGENMQKTRFEKHLIGPTNKVVANLDTVKNDATFAALSAQSAFALEQTSVPSNFWEPLKTYGSYIIDGLVNEDGTGGKLSYSTQLDKMVEQIKGSVGKA